MSIHDILTSPESRPMPVPTKGVGEAYRRSLVACGTVVADEIAWLMAEIGRMYCTPRAILDPHCGVGCILHFCDFAEERLGLERAQRLLRVAKVLDERIEFVHGDLLTQEVDRQFDMIVSAFAVGDPSHVRRPTDSWVQKKGYTGPYDCVVMERALNLLSPGGIAVFLVSMDVLTSTAYLKLRQRVIGSFSLDTVVYFPAGSVPYVGDATAAIAIRHGVPREFVSFEEYTGDPGRVLESIRDSAASIRVPTERVGHEWDPHRYGIKASSDTTVVAGVRTRRLVEIAEVVPGYAPRNEEKRCTGGYVVLTSTMVGVDRLDATTMHPEYVAHSDAPAFLNAIVRPGDIVVNLRGSPTSRMHTADDPSAVADSSVAIIRSRGDVGYLAAWLQGGALRKSYLWRAAGTVGAIDSSERTIEELRNLEVPILPVARLADLSDNSISQGSAEHLTRLRTDLRTMRDRIVDREAEVDWRLSLSRPGPDRDCERLEFASSAEAAQASQIRDSAEAEEFARVAKLEAEGKERFQLMVAFL